MAIRMQQRRGTADQWLLSDPVLGVGEIGFETDTNSFKIGDGVNSWATLDYFTKADKLVSFIYKTGSATLSLTDADKIVEVSGAATITVPTDAAAAFPVGTTINITQTGTGTVTVVGDSGVTVNSTPSNTLRDQWSSAVLIKRAANTWLLSGDML